MNIKNIKIEWRHWFSLADAQPYLKITGFFFLFTVWYFTFFWFLRSETGKYYPVLLTISHAIELYALIASLLVYYNVLRDHSRILSIGLIGVVVLFIALLLRDSLPYTYDVGQHASTIFYYAWHFSMPPASRYAESHQPPLYYMLSGLVLRFASFFDKPDHDYPALISLNYFFYMMFLLYGILSLLLTIRSQKLRYFGAIALMFWPGNMLHCSRIANDILVYLTFMGASYHLARWYQSDSMKQMELALLWLAASFLTKNSAIVLLLPMVLVIDHKCAKERHPFGWWFRLRSISYEKHIRPLRFVLLLLLFSLAITYGRNVYTMTQIPHTPLIGGMYGSALDPVWRPRDLLAFHYQTFLAIPYTYNPGGYDWFFWNYFLRTMSFGEYHWTGVVQAKMLNYFLLLTWIYLAGSMFSYAVLRRKPLGWAGYYGCFLSCGVLSLALAKMYYGGIFIWADTRHMYAIIPFFLLTYLNIVELYRPVNKIVSNAGIVLLGCYVATALVHYAIQFIDPVT